MSKIKLKHYPFCGGRAEIKPNDSRFRWKQLESDNVS